MAPTCLHDVRVLKAFKSENPTNRSRWVHVIHGRSFWRFPGSSSAALHAGQDRLSGADNSSAKRPKPVHLGRRKLRTVPEAIFVDYSIAYDPTKRAGQAMAVC